MKKLKQIWINISAFWYTHPLFVFLFYIFIYGGVLFAVALFLVHHTLHPL